MPVSTTRHSQQLTRSPHTVRQAFLFPHLCFIAVTTQITPISPQPVMVLYSPLKHFFGPPDANRSSRLLGPKDSHYHSCFGHSSPRKGRHPGLEASSSDPPVHKSRCCIPAITILLLLLPRPAHRKKARRNDIERSLSDPQRQTAARRKDGYEPCHGALQEALR